MKKILLAGVLLLSPPWLLAQDAPEDQTQSTQADAAAPAPEQEGTDTWTVEPVQREALAQEAAIETPALTDADADAAVAESIALPQVAPEPVSPVVADDEVRQIDEIVVTAQKTEQTLQEVPVSVTAVSAEFIKDTGSASLADISLYIPNVRIDADDLGSPQVFIRGFGTNAFNPSFESSVGLVQDEIFFGRAGYFTEALFDVERVEVLRGPQGTLFGKNTVAGVFNVTTRGPRLDEEVITADGRYLYGENNEQRIEAGVGGMVNEWMGVRISGQFIDKDGRLENTKLDRKEDSLTQKSGRVKLRFLSSAGFDTEVTAVKSQTSAPFWPFQLFKLDEGTRTYLESFDPRIEDDPYDFNTSFETQGYIEKGSDTLGLKTQWNVGEFAGLQDFTPVLVIGGSKFYIDQLNELDVSPADIARLDSHERHRQLSMELRFSGNAESLFGLGTGVEFVSGLFFFQSDYTLFARILAGADLGSYLATEDFCLLSPANVGGACDLLGIQPLPGIPLLGTVTAPLTANDFYQFDYTQAITSSAFFGQMTWYLTEKFAVTPGIRFSGEEKRVTTAGNAQCLGRQLLARPCVMEQLLESQDYNPPEMTRNETDVSPKLALQYFADHGINYYGSYTRGYKSGGYNSISFTGEGLEYEPEKAETVELGAKGKFLDRTLAINLTLYQTDFSNLQVLAFNGFFFDVSNAGAAESRGLEADFTWLTPYEPLRVIGSFGLLDARYKRYPNAPAPISEGINQNQDLAGRRIAFAPSSTGTLTPMLTYLLGAFNLTLAADVIYQGDQFTDTDLDPNSYVPAYTKYGARLILAAANESWALSLGGSNLTDERVLNQVTDATFFPGSYFAQQASGRQLFATISLRL